MMEFRNELSVKIAVITLIRSCMVEQYYKALKRPSIQSTLQEWIPQPVFDYLFQEYGKKY